MKPFTENELTKYFAYLDALRDSGITNMFAAPAYLRETFDGLDRPVSIAIFKAWSDTFAAAPVQERVKQFLRAA